MICWVCMYMAGYMYCCCPALMHTVAIKPYRHRVAFQPWITVFFICGYPAIDHCHGPLFILTQSFARAMWPGRSRFMDMRYFCITFWLTLNGAVPLVDACAILTTNLASRLISRLHAPKASLALMRCYL